jgi:hypothetical protein
MQPGISVLAVHANANRETAIVIPQSRCRKDYLDPGFDFDRCQEWQSVKHRLREQGLREIGVVTEVIKASRWVLDYRPATRSIHAVYVVVLQNSILGPTFRFEHYGGYAVRTSEAPEAEHVLFLRYRRESTCHLGPSWAVPLRVYIEPGVPLCLTWG